MRTLLTFTFLSIPLIGAFAIFALGISLIYRASRVLNLAHGAMAMVPAYLAYVLTVRMGLPMAVGLPAAIAAGAALGVGVERFFVRRLRRQGPTAQTVGTVAVTGILIAIVSRIFGATPLTAAPVFPKGELLIGGIPVGYGELGLLVTAIAVSVGLFLFFRFTEVGLALRGAAQNRRAAALMGIDPDLAAAAAWGLGGGLAALAGVLLGAVTAIDPYFLPLQVLPAFVAVLLGGLESLPGALAGATLAGLAFGLVPLLASVPGIGAVFRYSGSPQLLLTALALVVMAVRGRRFAAADAAEAGLVTMGRPFGSLNRRRFRPLVLAGVALVVAWPFFAPFSMLGTSLLAVELTLVAISIVVLTGWVGQISLAQASFVGISAFVTGMLVRNLGLGFPANLIGGSLAAAIAAAGLGVVALRVRGLYLAVATLIFAWMSDQFLLRSPLLEADAGSSTIPGQSLGLPGSYPAFDLTARRTLFVVMVAVLVAVIFSLANLRDTKTGRAFFAVRGSEMAAVSLGIDVVRYKLIAFALAGAIAGIGGNLIMIEQRTVAPGQFLFTVSLYFLSIAVVGGLGSLGGAIAAGVLFASLSEVFFQVEALSGWLEVVSAGLLVFVLLVYPGGLAAVPSGISSLFAQRTQRLAKGLRRLGGVRIRPFSSAPGSGSAKIQKSRRRATPAPSQASTRSSGRVGTVLAVPARVVRKFLSPAAGLLTRRRGLVLSTSSGDWLASAVVPEHSGSDTQEPSDDGRVPSGELRLEALAAEAAKPSGRSQGPPLIEAQGVTVRFGGLTALKDSSLTLREGEILGLIGPNGAGKTTLFNAILGLNNPAAGTVRLHSRDVSSMPPHLRARLGLARTFQVIQLFSELSVFDNLLVATHLRNRSGLLSNLAAAATTIKAEAEARGRVKRVLSLLDLEEVADQGVKGQPFGVLRMVELGRALVTGAPLLMLDEPASGLNEAETDRLSEVIAGVRSLGVSVLLIEHDVRMVTGVSDYIYVLDQGVMIAEGPPEEIQRNPKVIAAYLGEAEEETVKEKVRS